jgi:hypothetical protein
MVDEALGLCQGLQSLISKSQIFIKPDFVSCDDPSLDPDPLLPLKIW